MDFKIIDTPVKHSRSNSGALLEALRNLEDGKSISVKKSDMVKSFRGSFSSLAFRHHISVIISDAKDSWIVSKRPTAAQPQK